MTIRKDIVYEVDLPDYIDSIAQVGEKADYTDDLYAWHLRMSQEDQDNFNKRGTDILGPWPDWELRETESSDDHPNLEVTGRLRNSLLPGGGENINDVHKRESTWGTMVSYAEDHLLGGMVIASADLVPRGGGEVRVWAGETVEIPQRPFATITQEMVTTLGHTIAQSLIEQMKG
jgi:phage gpG-like protein